MRPLLPAVIGAVCITLSFALNDVIDESWKANYKPWRLRDTVSVSEWARRIPPPVPAIPAKTWDEMELPARRTHFKECITQEAQRLSKHVEAYRSPNLVEVQQVVKSLLRQRGLKVTVSIFWGRGRYVRVLWPYIERNLASNMGIIDEVLLITFNRDRNDGEKVAHDILESAVARFPNVVREVPFCPQPYGCAFDEIMSADDSVHIKLDDDIIFIKDGSFEHLVYQVLTNKDYTFYSGSVVNNPHGYALHTFVGAMAPTSFHFKSTRQNNVPPLYNYSMAYHLYWGKNVYDGPGGKMHESFIYNAASGRLDVYAFDIWNMNECKCADPQPAMDFCHNGFYRWSINAIAWTHNTSVKYGRPVPKFDEPVVSMGWTANIAPHRVGIVGEALFVHCQYTRQRMSKPDYGLVEEVLLPWHFTFMSQYTAGSFGSWAGNASLHALYEDMAIENGQIRYHP